MQPKNQTPQVEEKERVDSTDPRNEGTTSPEASIEQEEATDDAPDLDEEDLEENNLSDEEADNIEWEPGDEEKQQDE